MSRALVVSLAGLIALSSAPADAATGTSKTKSSIAKKKSLTAKQKKAAAAKKKRKKLAAAKKRKRSRASAKRKQVALAKVSTSRDGMPKGFEWPPSRAMKEASLACERALDGLGIRWERAKDEGKIANPVIVPSMEIGGIKYVSAYKKGPHKMDCQLVHTLAQVGPELVAIGVREVKFGSIYRNTNVRAHGTTKPILSRHALGIAMDIKSFTDDKGRVASVELDYLKGDVLLHGIEDTINRSQKFRTVLTPGNDPISHYDHFHIEATVDFTAFR